MKPTLQQEENLRVYLRKELRYRETYEEVYDHILSALMQKPADISFQDSINQIIKEDFGGGQGLLDMEKRWHQMVTDEMFGLQWKYFKFNFKFPNVVYTLILFSTFYLIVSQFGIASFIITFLLFAGIVVPSVLKLIRYFRIGYVTLDTKQSVKDSIMKEIGGKYSFWFVCVLIYKKDINILNSWLVTYPALITVIALAITCYLLYIVSFIKLSKDEFKFYATK